MDLYQIQTPQDEKSLVVEAAWYCEEKEGLCVLQGVWIEE